MSASLFGPNTKLIDEFTRRLDSFPWFTRIETPRPDDSGLTRVTLEFLLDQPVDPWNGAMGDAELRIDRQIIESCRLSEQYALQRAFREPWSTSQADAVLDVLLHRYPGNYKSTDSYAYELLDFPERTIRYALFECLVDDLVPRVTFFRDLMPWFEQGYWPCGWSGHHPDGSLMLL
ncbi:MAG TPA: hypothetical protein VFZ59_22025 [Verrucomicrobiae bacterium]|nr:hypothetical protein [Verrucomicrobiae bacterium]